MAEKIIRGIGCPSCGGSLEVSEGTRMLNCRYCGAGLLVTGERGISRFYVPLKFDKDAVMVNVKKWLSRIDKAPDLKRIATFNDAFPVYVPFWRVNAVAVGWVLGEVKKKKNDQTVWEPVEKKVCKRYEYSCPCCDIGEFGVKWVDLEGDEIRAFDLDEVQKIGMTFGILTSPTDAKNAAMRSFREWAEHAAKVDRVKLSKIHILHDRMTVVYYPLWIIRYEYKNRVYQITADGESSKLLYGRAPGNNLYRVVCLIGSVMLGNLVATSFIDLGNDDTWGWIILALIIIFLGFWKFRYGGEVKLEQRDKTGKTDITAWIPAFRSKEFQALMKKI